MFGFDKLITPKIINVLYGITMLLLVVAAIITFVNEGCWRFSALVMCCILPNILECIMVSFKNNEYLRRIAEAL